MNFVSQSPTRNRKRRACSPRSIMRLQTCHVTHSPVGCRVTPGFGPGGYRLQDEEHLDRRSPTGRRCRSPTPTSSLLGSGRTPATTGQYPAAPGQALPHAGCSRLSPARAGGQDLRARRGFDRGPTSGSPERGGQPAPG
jgi:hypothetical protein